ncbi:MAG TPA: hypothetical protein VLV86_09300 [Vicinamibacterales bacterium]|nr:hypothetical protein [Vicinamibacterales bacterium]
MEHCFDNPSPATYIQRVTSRSSWRRFAGTRVLALLLAAIVSVGTAGFGHSGWDDRACDPIPVHHDHNAHRFQSGALSPDAPDHCLFCHSLRSLRNGVVETYDAVPDTTCAAEIRVGGFTANSNLLTSHAPSRAPPARLL